MLAALGNLHTSIPKDVQQLTWYAEGVPEQPPVLLVDGRADDQLSFQRWQNSRGLKTYSAEGNGSQFSIVKRSIKHRQLTLSFLPFAPPVTLQVLVFRGPSTADTTAAGGLVCSGSMTRFPSRLIGCLARHGKDVSLKLSPIQWSEVRIVVVAALWVPLRNVQGYVPGHNQQSWKILLSPDLTAK